MIQPDQYLNALWLLSIDMQGLQFRFASERCEVLTNERQSLRFEPGLDISFETSYELLSDSPDLLVVPVEVVWPVSLASLIARGYDLAGATGELSIVARGATHEGRQVLMRGTIDAPGYGADGEPISFSLRQTPIDDQSTFIDPANEINETRYPDADDAAFGRLPPIVFGWPGRGECPGSPLAITDFPSEYCLIFGHPRYEGASGTITVTNNTQEVSYSAVPFAVNNQPAIVSLAGKLPAIAAGDELWAVYSEPTALADPIVANSPLRGAGSLLLYCMQQTSMEFDRRAFVEVASRLNVYEVDGYIDNDTPVWPWVQQNILPIVPVSIVAGPRGLYPIAWQPPANADDYSAVLDTDRNVDLIGGVQYKTVDIYNQITVKYFLRPDTDQYLKRVTVGPQDADNGLSSIAKTSAAKYGLRRKIIETPIVYEEKTAWRIALDQLRLYASPRRSVVVSASWNFAWLRRGDRVKIRCADLYLERIALIQAINYTPTNIEFTLVFNEDPLIESGPFG